MTTQESAARAGAGRVVSAIDELIALTEGLLPEGVHRALTAARTRLAEDRFNLAVLGEFKRGKSTLINALLDRDVLPAGVIPLTSVVTLIRAGSDHRLIVSYRDGRKEQRPVEHIAKYVTEEQNPANERGVDLVYLELDHELLWTGLELVDTPGIGSIHDHNSAVARGFLPAVDAAMCVLDAGQPLSDVERGFFAEAAERVPRLLIVVNKIDHLDHDDQARAVEFIRSAVEPLFEAGEPELFSVSARTRVGIPALASRLRRLAAEERRALLVRSAAALAKDVAADGVQAAQFEARAIELPLDELARRAREFEERIKQLRIARSEAGDLLHQGVGRALRQHVNEPLTGYARLQTTRLLTVFDDHLATVGSLSPRELSAELERWIDATVRAEFDRLIPTFEAAIADELTRLQQRYAGRVQQILEQVQEAAEDVFGSRAGEVMPEAGLRAPSAFTFKLQDVEHGLDMLVGFGRTITPGPLGRRLVVRDARRRLIEMTDRHAGRLRSELSERVTATTREYQRELATAVDDAVDAIQAAIDRADEDHRGGEHRAKRRLDELARIADRCEQLAAQFASSAAAGSNHQ